MFSRIQEGYNTVIDMKLIPYAQRRDSKFTQRLSPAKKNLGGDCMHGYMKSKLRVNVSGLHYSRQIIDFLTN